MNDLEFEVRVPIQLMTAHISHAARGVWIAVRSFQGSGEYCRASLETIGTRVVTSEGKPMNKSRVSKQIKLLVDAGWIVDDGRLKLKCANPYDNTCAQIKQVDQKSTSGPKVNKHKNGESGPKVNRKLTRSQPKVDQKSTRTENQNENQNENQTREGGRKKTRKVKTPTLDEVRKHMKHYCAEKGLRVNIELESETCFLHYEQWGWKRKGGQKIQNWKSAVSKWALRSKEFSRGGGTKRNGSRYHAPNRVRTYDGTNDPDLKFMYD